MLKPTFWSGDVNCDFNKSHDTHLVFIDGKTKMGPWAGMCESCFRRYGFGRYGTGFAQRYERQADDRYLKVDG